ncbi:MAG TPA: GTP pyrophosphokinase [Planctomycetaceae bacterium]|nr:GTP pyrophosphokinase [Planctomycetaceae bacterium]
MSAHSSIDQALLLAVQSFQGVKDEDGQPYIMHCLRVMMNFTDPSLQQVAILHDLIEDTPVTLEQLREMGFSPQVIQAIGLLTRTSDVSYADYVCRLKPNALARQVKMADLRDNSDVRRMLYRSTSTQKDLRRAARYVLSYQFLDDRLTQAEYLQSMAEIDPL